MGSYFECCLQRRTWPTVAARIGYLCCAFVLSGGLSATVTAQDDTEQEQQTLIRVSEETTRVTSPLTPNGYVDYVGAMNERYSKGVTPQNNFEVVLRELMGSSEIEELMREEYYRRIGIPLPDKEAGLYVDMQTYFQSVNVNLETNAFFDRFNARMEHPWDAKTDPAAAGWFQANKAALDQLEAGTKRDRFYTPYLVPGAEPQSVVTTINVILPTIQECRSLARALKIRAMYHLGNDEPQEAWEATLAMQRMARLVARGSTIIEALVGIAIHAMAYDTQAQILVEDSVTPEMRKQFLADLRGLKPEAVMGRKIDEGERLMGLSAVQHLAYESKKDLAKSVDDLAGGPFAGYARMLSIGAIDWNVVLIKMNEYYDLLVAYSRETDLRKRDLLRVDLDNRIKEARGRFSGPVKSGLAALLSSPERRGDMMADLLVSLLLPAVQQAQNAEDRIQARAITTEVGAAILSYKDQHGHYPELLDELKGMFPNGIPRDPFTTESLRYRKTDGGFVVYSLGINQRDDQGATYGEPPNERDRPDDLRFQYSYKHVE